MHAQILRSVCGEVWSFHPDDPAIARSVNIHARLEAVVIGLHEQEIAGVIREGGSCCPGYTVASMPTPYFHSRKRRDCALCD